MQEFTKPDLSMVLVTNSFLIKPLHPKVVSALMRTKTPSPCRVVSDSYQPKSGDLREKIIHSPLLLPEAAPEIFKKTVMLNLKRNSLLGRRPTKEF